MENKRFAVDIGVTLSGNLINACLTMLTIVGAIFIFIIEKRIVNIFFYLFISLSFLCFIFSIICGGKGINIARQKAIKNKLKLSYTKKHFNIQAITCLLGAIFFISSIFFTIEKEDPSHNILHNNEKMADSLQVQINSLKSDIEALKK